jgi:mono/diheme cytochrome c family protein
MHPYRRSLTIIGVTALLAGVALFGQAPAKKGPLQSPKNRPWPAPVQKVSDEQPVLKPEDAIKTFWMPPGYHIELVASDPLIQDPIKMEFDGDGRLWVLNMYGWAVDGEAMRNSFEPTSELDILEDTDGDGVYDKKTVFLDHLILPRAFKILDHNCALVGEPPHLWKACDTNGDLKADTKELVDDTFATQGVVEHGANGLYWAMDNWIYVAEHTWDLLPKGGKFEVKPSLNRGQWGLTQDDAGRLFRDVNTDPLYVDYTPPRYFMRNPNTARTSGLYNNLVDQEETLVWPVRPTLGVNRGYREEVPRPDGSAYYYQGVSNPMIFRGDALPKEIQGQPFVVDGPTNIVHLLKLMDDGTGILKARDYYQKGEFLASVDERFRPVDLALGWDGTLYIVDMYRGVSQDGPIQTDYLREYIKKRKLWEGIHYGRIYRVVHDTSKFDAKPHMIEETPAQLVAHLSSTNGWTRDTAQQLLVQRNDKSVVPALTSLATKAADWRFRLQAMATLDGMDSIDQATVTTALNDKDPNVRAAGIRMSERWLSQPGNPLQALVLKKMDDPSWTVRHQLAASIGEMPKDARVAPIVTMLRKYGNDDVTVDAAVSSIPGQESEVITALIADPGTAARAVVVPRKGPGVAGGRAGTTVPGLEQNMIAPPSQFELNSMAKPGADAIAQLAAAAARSKNPAAAQTIISLAVDSSKPEALRFAILQGAATGVAPAGRGGGGGGMGGGGGRGGRGAAATPPLTLSAEPAALISLSNAGGDLGAQAKKIVAGVMWPGKPAPKVEPISRTPEQQARYDAGQKIYAQKCEGCHKDQGQGAEGEAAALASSKWVTGQTAVLIRIMTAGKEGSVGLMPPLGSTMSDDDVAAVLTYIRGSFGNRATPVQPAEVKETRLMYSYRKTPWSEQELNTGRGRGGGGGGN